VFLDSPERIAAAIEYIEQNPIQGGAREAGVGFVMPYPGQRVSGKP
jgi:hypothetical protein